MFACYSLMLVMGPVVIISFQDLIQSPKKQVLDQKMSYFTSTVIRYETAFLCLKMLVEMLITVTIIKNETKFEYTII